MMFIIMTMMIPLAMMILTKAISPILNEYFFLLVK